MNYEIFQSIQDKYCSDVDCEDFKYPGRLQAYIKKHEVKEFFDINPQLEKFTKASRKLKLKIDIGLTSKVAKVVDLKSSLAALLDLTPSALRLFSIEEGCVVVTFFIPAFVADVVFPANNNFSTKYEEGFRRLSILRLICGNFNWKCGDEGIFVQSMSKNNGSNIRTLYVVLIPT